jgi:hypothetical protein
MLSASFGIPLAQYSSRLKRSHKLKLVPLYQKQSRVLGIAKNTQFDPTLISRCCNMTTMDWFFFDTVLTVSILDHAMRPSSRKKPTFGLSDHYTPWRHLAYRLVPRAS